MAGGQRPLFLERGTYRRRRKLDAVKLLAFFGAGLWLFPVLWPHASADTGKGVAMSSALTFVFGVWLALIVVSALLASGLQANTGTETEPDGSPPETGP